MSTNAPSRQADQFVVRLPFGLRDKIKEEAAKAGRSMNAEVVHHLTRAYDGRARAVIEEARAIFGDAAAAQLAAIHGSEAAQDRAA